ncbi:hypothetical protein D3C86_2046650 [compost metagenome]
MAWFLITRYPVNRIDRQVAFGKPNAIRPPTHIPCRSWLASEGGGSVNIFIACYDAFAGKPAPTGG